ncbi:MAG: hypothetical protein E7576_07930 [Ruminococcaceae bacterium]|nr:hypothetical protein [Oscillospiraceae bacterium]
MPDYGLTPTGPNTKRLDVILDEMHTQLSEAWGVNTRKDPQSFLNHLLTNIADQLADLWAFGEDVYYSQYPTSAEGASLDYSAEYGGIVREAAAKSYYRVLCTGKDGTIIPARTIIASNTTPATQLSITENAQITSADFNTAKIIIAEPGTKSVLAVELNSELYQFEPDSTKTDAENLAGLAGVLNAAPGFTAKVEERAIVLAAEDEISSNTLIMSENLTTESVGSVITFSTVEDGDILIPPGVVTKIQMAVAGLESVTNVGGYIAGRKAETDTELRQSYIDKIYNRSSSMAESIRSAILEQVQGVSTCTVYENYTNLVDEYGRYPHSVEVVADGEFDEILLAQVILNTKAGGINTYGSREIDLPGLYGEPITIRYNKPVPVYIWFKVVVFMNGSTNAPTNYVDLIEGIITEWMDGLSAGDDVAPQTIIHKLYAMIPGVDYFDIYLSSTEDEVALPSEYPDRRVEITDRQKAYTSPGRIEVTLGG